MFMQGAIFDLDGTLLNSMGLWRHAGEIYLKNLGITAEEGLADTILKMTIRGAAQYLIERYSLPCSVEEAAGGINGVMESAYATVITPKDGAEQLLQALALRGIPMAVATATDRYLVEIALRRLGLIKYFKGIVTCTEVGVGKRDGADVYEAALKLTGSAKRHTWVFEDSPHAARTAREAGFMVAGVEDDDGKNDVAELQKYCNIFLASLLPTEGVLKKIAGFEAKNKLNCN